MPINNEGARKVTLSDIIKICIALIVLWALLSMRRIFPDSPMIQKYFSGPLGVLWYVLFWIVLIVREVIVRRNKKKQESNKGQG